MHLKNGLLATERSSMVGVVKMAISTLPQSKKTTVTNGCRVLACIGMLLVLSGCGAGGWRLWDSGNSYDGPSTSEQYPTSRSQGAQNPRLRSGGTQQLNPFQPGESLRVPGIPIPVGAQVLLGESAMLGTDATWTGQLVLQSENFTPVQILSFYRNQMPKFGWLELDVVRSSRTSVIFRSREDGRLAVMRITKTPRTDGAEVDIVMVGPGVLERR